VLETDGDLIGFCPGRSETGSKGGAAPLGFPSRRWRVANHSVGWPTSFLRQPAFSARCDFLVDASGYGRAPVAYGGAASCRAEVRLACDAERRERAVEVADAVLSCTCLSWPMTR
jgi:hypothetical protein